MMEYESFLKSKKRATQSHPIQQTHEQNAALFPFQSSVVKWALNKGRACIFADCGLGKTLMQLEWASHVPGRTIILTPLAVAEQTEQEALKFGYSASVARTAKAIKHDITITNYEMLHAFDPSQFTAVVLDESSILKSFDGKTRNELVRSFVNTQNKLCCTATPAPNDFMELGNHAEFLGICTMAEMLATFFVHDAARTSSWRVKGHAKKEFWSWVASWALVFRKPSDIGFSDDGFNLPPFTIEHHAIVEDATDRGCIVAPLADTLSDRRAAKRNTIHERIAKAKEIADATPDATLVWCQLNAEGSALTSTIADAVEVQGADDPHTKAERMLGFSSGKYRVLVTKPSIAGFGMNWQHCNTQVFASVNDSFEQFYQATRRSWRFGQTRPVTAHLIYAEPEILTIRNIERKWHEHDEFMAEVVDAMKTEMQRELHSFGGQEIDTPTNKITHGEGWTLVNGDSCEQLKSVRPESVDYIIYSPPFSSLYTYTDSARDLGNSQNDAEFFEHYKFIVDELFRALKPGRLLSFHCMLLPKSKCRDGVIGLKDLRGDLIRIHESAGFVHHSEVVIWKDPVTAMQRTKAIGLLYKQLRKDSTMSRQGIPDYLVTMRKPGVNTSPVTHTPETFPLPQWQRYASPVWMDINQTRVLSYRAARDERDERHICPLQLDVIERAIDLWTNEGDMVLSPFAGVGSEGYVSVQKGRKFWGCELKPSYYAQAVANMTDAQTVNEDLLTGIEVG